MTKNNVITQKPSLLPMSTRSLGAHQSAQLEWSNVSYTVKKALESKACRKKRFEALTILHELSGHVAPGQMLAIMGPSGSGKTTLLNVLAGVIPAKKWSGTVLLNGQPASRKRLRQLCAFVPQEDILMGSQTVREALLFYARLRLPALAKWQCEERVDKIIAELGLTKVRNSLIGYVGADATNSGLRRGLSGGERKRVSIGQQLVTNPSLLFLDEPTTGLDSFAAESIVRTLADQLQLGRTVIFTIHQPSATIMNLFDRLLLLGHGRLMYFGAYRTALTYFKSIGYRCPSDENPGDYFLELLHKEPKKARKGHKATKNIKEDEKLELIADLLENAPTGYEETQERAKELATKFSESPLYAHTHAATDEKSVQRNPEALQLKAAEKKRSAGFFRQMQQLTWRNTLNAVREPSAFRSALIQSVVVALIMGLVYLQLERDQKAIQDRAGAVFFAVIFVMFGGLLGPFAMFATERKQYIFQVREGLYSTHAYYVARFLSELPKLFLTSVAFALVFYFLIGLRLTADAFFVFVLFGFLIATAAFVFATVIIGAFPNPAVALTVFPLFFLPMMIFSGFYTNSDNTPVYFIWAEWLSFVKYTFRALMNNEMAGTTFVCTAEELAVNKGTCPYTRGEQWLRFRKLDDVPIYGDALILVLFILAFGALGWFLTHRIAKTSRK